MRERGDGGRRPRRALPAPKMAAALRRKGRPGGAGRSGAVRSRAERSGLPRPCGEPSRAERGSGGARAAAAAAISQLSPHGAGLSGAGRRGAMQCADPAAAMKGPEGEGKAEPPAAAGQSGGKSGGGRGAKGWHYRWARRGRGGGGGGCGSRRCSESPGRVAVPSAGTARAAPRGWLLAASCKPPRGLVLNLYYF